MDHPARRFPLVAILVLSSLLFLLGVVVANLQIENALAQFSKVYLTGLEGASERARWHSAIERRDTLAILAIICAFTALSVVLRRHVSGHYLWLLRAWVAFGPLLLSFAYHFLAYGPCSECREPENLYSRWTENLVGWVSLASALAALNALPFRSMRTRMTASLACIFFIYLVLPIIIVFSNIGPHL